MSALRVPVALLPAVIATEVRGSLAISIAGGFLLLVANGAGPLSVDRHFAK
jgi:uncharacterized membrane protein YphA (DoxX/SURF4 family)